jgi:integrase
MEFLQREELLMATQPIERPVTPLRQRMLDDMAMRTMRAPTQHDYVRHVRAFAAFLGRSPDTATAEDVRRFQLHQREHGVGESTINGTVSALRFRFDVTLERPDLSRRLVLAHRPRKLPDVLSVDEVAKLLEAAPGIKYRAALGVAYGAGLRMSEVAHLKADDIDSKRMLIRIEEGKGRKDRNAMLSPQLLELLRLWWREGKRRSVLLPHGWLFPGRSYTVHGMRSAFRDYIGDMTNHPESIVEQALAHQIGDETTRAYRRGDAFLKRRALMKDWEGYLDSTSVKPKPAKGRRKPEQERLAA